METIKKTNRKVGNPNWRKGISGNPKGRPTNAEIDLLRQAIEKGAKKYGKTIFEHAVERAFQSDTVLVALLKKFIPDRQFTEGEAVKVINLIYGYRNGNGFENSPIRNEGRPI